METAKDGSLGHFGKEGNFKLKMMKFEDVEWHDQTLIGIYIDRTNPGNNDSIELKVLIDEVEMTVLFENVYFADIKMNFGVIAQESIRYAIINYEDCEITNIQTKWSKARGVLDKLLCFEINTNSTNSITKIYALSCKINRCM
jgi:hypothetical protein